ncbi:hypothetical protein L1987_72568 [Smallanthus sonchifolius]|uniref:Uncharacterized protein n=1 Tax=Smallanthus sonchifolius TaxID=185202 RepID=A0ACB9AWE5_9ASTR|nr:hypothetical protein L1987_72568 [Smallanthus sonchifolius]
MPMKKDSSATGPPSTSTCFLGCFGCSGKKPHLTDEVNSGSRHRRRRWISKWRFSFKKPPTKTVPVDLPTAPEKSEPVTNAPTTAGSTWEENENPTLTKKHAITVEENKPRRKKWTVAVKSQDGSNRSRQKEIKPAATSAPEQKTVTMAHTLVSSPLKPLMITHSKSQPLATRQKHPHAPPVDEGVRRKSGPSGGEFDSISGMSVILVILVILVLWGKLCAILCTSSWFFIAPRLVAAGQRSAVDSADKRPPGADNNLDLESVEYKKKVILEGLLQRNHRNIAGRL